MTNNLKENSEKILKIDVIAPSSAPVNIENLEESITTFLKERFPSSEITMKFDPTFKNSKYRTTDTKQNRINFLKEAITSDADIIWALRGGYGSAELIDDLKDIKLGKDKLLIGFSDITSLHFLFGNHYNLPSLHGPVITQLIGNTINQESINFTFDFINKIYSSKKDSSYSLQYALQPVNQKALLSRNINGKLTGGNLTTVDSIKHLYENNSYMDSSILLLEEVGENTGRVRKILHACATSNFLYRHKAIIIGDFTDENSNKVDMINYVNYLTSEEGGVLDIKKLPPVFVIEKVGHGKDNLCLPLNYNLSIDLHQPDPNDSNNKQFFLNVDLKQMSETFLRR